MSAPQHAALSTFLDECQDLLSQVEDVTLGGNVGGGIVHDSDAASEWQEALCKSAFLAPSPTA